MQDSSHPADLPDRQDLDFVGSPVAIDRTGCGGLVVAADKNDVIYAWHRGELAAGPVWELALETYDPNNPLLSQLAWQPSLASLYAVTGSELVRIQIAADCSASVAWRRPLGTRTENGSPTIEGDTIWFAVNGRNVLAGYDARTGARLAEVPLGGTTLEAPTIVDHSLVVGTFTGLVEGFSLGKASLPTHAASAGKVAAESSWADARHGWQSRASGVYATDDAGRSWRRIYAQPALAVARVSKSAGLIDVGVDPGRCMCTTRKLWTDGRRQELARDEGRRRRLHGQRRRSLLVAAGRDARAHRGSRCSPAGRPRARAPPSRFRTARSWAPPRSRTGSSRSSRAASAARAGTPPRACSSCTGRRRPRSCSRRSRAARSRGRSRRAGRSSPSRRPTSGRAGAVGHVDVERRRPELAGGFVACPTLKLRRDPLSDGGAEAVDRGDVAGSIEPDCHAGVDCRSQRGRARSVARARRRPCRRRTSLPSSRRTRACVSPSLTPCQPVNGLGCVAVAPAPGSASASVARKRHDDPAHRCPDDRTAAARALACAPMLELRPNCELCDKDLPPDPPDARICSYECTFCAACVEDVLHDVCPNCGGGFQVRPIRPAQAWREGTGLVNDPPGDAAPPHAVHPRGARRVRRNPARGSAGRALGTPTRAGRHSRRALAVRPRPHECVRRPDAGRGRACRRSRGSRPARRSRGPGSAARPPR